jgi:uncharacterized protein (DUF1499 family)
MPMKPIPLLVAACVVAVPVLVLAIQGARSRRNPPASLGPAGDGLAACPSSPNCVGSSERAGRRSEAPLRHRGSPDETRRRLLDALQRFPRARIVTDAWPYLHVEFQSRWFGFVDDVEFLSNDANGRIDFLSASRVGYYDLGVNRRRMAELRRLFEGAEGSADAEAAP